MKRIVLYLLPALIDLHVGAFFFVCTVRMAESGASATAVSAVLAAWGVAYMGTCLFMGRIVTIVNAPRIMILSCVLMALNAIAFIVFDGLGMIYVLIAVQGVFLGFFFTPFQIFMKELESGRGMDLSRSTALYTFAWSMGLAAGPFVAGYVWEAKGWQWCYVLNFVLAVLAILGVVWLRASYSPRDARGENNSSSSHGTHTDRSPAADFAWLGWVASGGCLLVLTAIRTVFPVNAAALQISKPAQGTTLALICWGQAATALLLLSNRTWMYRARWVGPFGLLGLVGVFLFWWARTPIAFYLAALALGMYAGSALIYIVYHSLVHVSRAPRNISINESIVGLTGIVGPLIAGALADGIGYSAPFVVCGILVGAAVLLQCIVHVRIPLDIRLFSQDTTFGQSKDD